MPGAVESRPIDAPAPSGCVTRPDRTRPLGAREPGASPGQACCCDGPINPRRVSHCASGKASGGPKPEDRPSGGIALTSRGTMQPAVPRPAGPRLCLLARTRPGAGRLLGDRGADRMSEGDSRRTPVVMSWSGGKDSALALHELMRDPRYEVVALMTSVSEEFRRISHHGVREELLEAQAAAIGLPLVKISLPS